MRVAFGSGVSGRICRVTMAKYNDNKKVFYGLKTIYDLCHTLTKKDHKINSPASIEPRLGREK